MKKNNRQIDYKVMESKFNEWKEDIKANPVLMVIIKIKLRNIKK